MSEYYDLKGKERSFLFGNSGIESKVGTDILFLNYVDAAKKIHADVKPERTLLLCVEEDYPRIGRKVRDNLERISVIAETVTLASDCLTENCFFALAGGKFDLLLALGDGELLLLAKKVAYKSGAALAAFPTSCRQSDLLLSAPKAPNFAVIDTALYTSPKKQYNAEAFGELISSSLDLIDYKTAVLCGKATFDRQLYDLVSESVGIAINVRKFENVSDGLMLGELKLSLAREYSEVCDRSAVGIAADFLGKIADAPYGERRLRAFYALLPLYALYLSADMPFGYVIPDPLKAAADIAQFTGEAEYDFVNSMTSLPTEEKLIAERRIKRLVRKSFADELDTVSSRLEGIRKNYAYLYSGKHRLSDYSASDVKKSIKAAAYFSEGNLLAFMRDEGFAEFI